MRAGGLLLAAILTAGCVNGTGDVESSSAVPANVQPAIIVDYEAVVLGAESDVQCRNGGGPQLERSGPRIEAGHGSLHFTVTAGTQTGLQAGYAVDDAEPTWLPVVTGGTREFDVEVAPDAVETDAARWHFWYQLNLPGAEQDCYTGAGTGPRAIRILAQPTP